MRRTTLARTVLASVAALAVVWLTAASFQGRRTPAHTAAAAVPALGLVVTAELFILSDLTEFERHLTLAAGGATLQARMADSQGPADRTGLYRVGNGAEIAVLGPAGDVAAFAVGPLRRLDRPSRDPAEWTCLGAFELSFTPHAGGRGRAQTFAFAPAARERDCPAPPPSPADEPAHRARAVQNSTMPASADRSGPGGKASSAESAAPP